MQVKKQQLEPYTEQQTGSKLGNSLTRLYIVALLNYKCQVGWITSWNQDCWEKYQQPQICRGSSLVAQTVKCLPAMWETQVQSLGREDALEKEMATYTSTLAWKITRRSLVGYSPWGCKESDTTEWLHLFFFRYTDDTTLIGESEDELKRLFMSAKEGSEKAGL